VGRHENVGTPQRVISPVRDVVKYVLHGFEEEYLVEGKEKVGVKR
jgi:hypothetical protein